MPLIDQIREQKLIELAKARFDLDLSDAELKVLHDSASSEDLPEPDEKAPRPEVRADFLRWLATDSEAAPYIDPKGLRVYAATIPGELDLEECHVHPTLDFRCCDFLAEINVRTAETRSLFFFNSSLAKGICADGLIVHGPLFLRGSSFSGEIRLTGAKITGDLDCSGAKLEVKEGVALSVDRAQIGGNVFLRDGFTSSGEIRLIGAQIKGDLDCSGAKLKVKEGDALSADDAEIGGNVVLREGFESSGTIRLLGAWIKNNLECSGAKLEVKDRDAVFADGAKIGGNVFLREGFESSGTIRLPGAEIAGQLDCSGAKLKAKGNALSADSVKIGGYVFLEEGFESEDAIRLTGAVIGGDLAVRGAKVAGVVCKNMVVKGDLFWQHIEKTEKTKLNLVGAKVKNLCDDKMSWPDEGNLYLDGLVYEGLKLYASLSNEDIKTSLYSRELPLKARDRIVWLELQSKENVVAAQPWVQLANLLNASGDPEGAREVLYAYRRHSRGPKVLVRGKTYLFDQLEQWPLKISVPIAILGAIGSLVFWRAHRMKMMAPTEKEAFEVFLESGSVPARYEPFDPFIYSLENVLPVVRLGQDGAWRPNPQVEPRSWLPERPEWLKGMAEQWTVTRWICRMSYKRLAYLRWSLILLGWVLAIILATALAEHFKK